MPCFQGCSRVFMDFVLGRDSYLGSRVPGLPPVPASHIHYSIGSVVAQQPVCYSSIADVRQWGKDAPWNHSIPDLSSSPQESTHPLSLGASLSCC
jgi:hypothetical protein